MPYKLARAGCEGVFGALAWIGCSSDVLSSALIFATLVDRE
jgi:hypothetical protein